MMKNLSLKICLTIVALLSATVSHSADIRTTVETTSVINEQEINAATLGQLVRALRSFHGKTIKVNGLLYTYIDTLYLFRSSDKILMTVTLDDGRGTSKRAKTCTESSPCRVKMDLDVTVGDKYSEEYLGIGGIGYNVEFNK
jgi:hypothetical protein